MEDANTILFLRFADYQSLSVGRRRKQIHRPAKRLKYEFTLSVALGKIYQTIAQTSVCQRGELDT